MSSELVLFTGSFVCLGHSKISIVLIFHNYIMLHGEERGAQYSEFIIFFKWSWCKIASAARN